MIPASRASLLWVRASCAARRSRRRPHQQQAQHDSYRQAPGAEMASAKRAGPGSERGDEPEHQQHEQQDTAPPAANSPSVTYSDVFREEGGPGGGG
ncbi:hypothetical protein ACU4GD_16850 [Cupriavidus basilensis]